MSQNSTLLEPDTDLRSAYRLAERDSAVLGIQGMENPISLHKYLYANANPISQNDPSGYFGLIDLMLGSAGNAALTATVTAAAATTAVYAMSETNAISDAISGIEEVYSELEATAFVTTGAVVSEILSGANSIAGYFAAQNANNNNSNAGAQKPSSPVPSIPAGWDGKTAPGPDWIWVGPGQPGSSQGNWHNPGTGESLNPDPSHAPPIGPHVDWIDPNGKKWRIFPDGRVLPK